MNARDLFIPLICERIVEDGYASPEITELLAQEVAAAEERWCMNARFDEIVDHG